MDIFAFQEFPEARVVLIIIAFEDRVDADNFKLSIGDLIGEHLLPMFQQRDRKLIAAWAPKLKKIDDHHAALEILQLRRCAVDPVGNLPFRCLTGHIGRHCIGWQKDQK